MALVLNTTGSFNTALGAFTMQYNNTGDNNTAVGEVALSQMALVATIRQ